MEYIWKITKNNLLTSILLIAAMLSSFWGLPKADYINWQVIALLFNLMIVVAVFQRYKLLDLIAVKILNLASNEKNLTRIMLVLSAISAMLITNDVALITFVPITLLIGLKININTVRIIVLQTIAANLGSSFTPLGNPQNLFLYAYYHYSWWTFVGQMFILQLLAVALLWWLTKYIETIKFELKLEPPQLKRPLIVIIFIFLFIAILLSVGQIFNYQNITILIIAISLITVPKIIREVDYSLLLTFILFFIVIGNISHISEVAEYLHVFLKGSLATFLTATILSQFISNVPTAIMLSPFTSEKMALLWGVNIGGMGTMIASMASLISYRIYLRHFPLYSGNYIQTYIKYNLSGLVLFLPISSLLLLLFN